jgi:hypothetical protein
MSDWLDVAGSFVIGGIVILTFVNLNLTISVSASENLYSGIVQGEVTSAADLLEHDFYKIGYRCSGNIIEIADSNEIVFYSDIDNDGGPDEINYFVGDEESFTETGNPNDFLLTREKNKEKPAASIPVVDFKLTYYDSLGQKIDYTLLSSQAERDKIKTIGIRMKCESADMIDNHYEAVEWEKTIKPKNI